MKEYSNEWLLDQYPSEFNGQYDLKNILETTDMFEEYELVRDDINEYREKLNEPNVDRSRYERFIWDCEDELDQIILEAIREYALFLIEENDTDSINENFYHKIRG